MPETVKEVQSPYSKEQWVSVRIRFPYDEWEKVRREAGQHTESWVRTAVRRALDKT